MAKQKNTPSKPAGTDPEVEAKVDAMMHVDAPEGAPDVTEPLDIFEGQEAPLPAPSDAPTTLSSAPLLPHARKSSASTSTAKPTAETAKPVTKSEPATKAETDDIPVKELDIDSPQTDAAIDDIVAQEADEVLAAQDAGILAASQAATEKDLPEPRRRGHPVFWFMVVLVVTVAILAATVLLSPGLSPVFAP